MVFQEYFYMWQIYSRTVFFYGKTFDLILIFLFDKKKTTVKVFCFLLCVALNKILLLNYTFLVSTSKKKRTLMTGH